MDKIIGLGNALIDVLATLKDDTLLDELELPKGSMQLIDDASAGNGAQIGRSGIRLCRKMPILSRFRMRPQMQPSLPASGQSTSLA